MPNDKSFSESAKPKRSAEQQKIIKRRFETVTVVTAIILILAFLGFMLIRGLKGENFYSKDELLQIMEQTPADPSSQYVSDCLTAWHFPKFDEAELDCVEVYYRAFYYAVIPSPAELANDVASDFLEVEYDFINVSDEDEVTRSLIACLIASIGDDYGVFRTPEEQTEYNESHSGKYAGIGIAVMKSETDNEYIVTQVYKDSPAAKAGFVEGDAIIGAAGLTIEKDGYDAVINSVRGEIGTSVEVNVKRGDQLITLTAVREQIEEQTVTYEINGDNIGYVRITGFKQITAQQFADAIDAIEAAGCKGIIFDLRSNGGGLLKSVIDMLSYLVPDGTPISSFSTVSELSKKDPYFASYEDSDSEDTDHVLSIPAVYICNKYTASAAELFCSALRDYGEMGLLKTSGVGERSFGKGIMQGGVRLPTGSYLTLTTNLYNSPKGENYHGIGVLPKVIIKDLDNTDPIPTAIEVLLGLVGQP